MVRSDPNSDQKNEKASEGLLKSYGSLKTNKKPSEGLSKSYRSVNKTKGPGTYEAPERSFTISVF